MVKIVILSIFLTFNKDSTITILPLKTIYKGTETYGKDTYVFKNGKNKLILVDIPNKYNFNDTLIINKKK